METRRLRGPVPAALLTVLGLVAFMLLTWQAIGDPLGFWHGQELFREPGRHDENRFISAADVLAGKVAPVNFARKVVMIGVTAVGLSDYQATPVAERMAGVEIHAQLLENIFDADLLSRPRAVRWATMTHDSTSSREGDPMRRCWPLLLLVAWGLFRAGADRAPDGGVGHSRDDPGGAA